MSKRAGHFLLALALVVGFLCAGLVAWRLTRSSESKQRPSPLPEASQAAKPRPAQPVKISTIIDLPGDPVLAPHASAVAPKELHFALPARLAANAAKVDEDGFYVADTLVSTTGGYMGKFPDAGQEADALAAELAMNAAAMANAPGAADVASDDDGGDETPPDAAAAMLTEANSNQLDVTLGAKPQLKLVTLKTVVPEKISELLVANGYSAESAEAVEAASKQIFNVQTLPAESVVLAAGALDSSGAYRVTQLAIYEAREYVGAIALFENGAYGEGARPTAPDGLFDDAPATIGARYTLADGIYSAGLRNGVPEPVIREAIQALQRLMDLKAPLPADETFRVLYTRDPRNHAKTGGRLVYAGVAGSAGVRDCYAFESADGSLRCFDPNARTAPAASSSAPAAPSAAPVSLGDSGASSVGGILAPIRGAPVTSLFGMRFHPILHILRLHAGIDFGAPVGSQVRAAADGKIEIAGPVHGFGNHIRIQHKGFETSYSHLSEIPDAIHPGAEVKEGEIIALSGNTGLSTGPHLHFEFYEGGSAVDPMPHLGREVQAGAPTAGSGKAPENPPMPPIQSPSTSVAGEASAFPAIKSMVDVVLEAAAR